MSSFSSLLEEVKDVKHFRLGDVCDIVSSGTVFGPKLYRNIGFPVLKMSNIQNGQIVADDLSYCDPTNHPNAKLVRWGDVVISRCATAGRVGINLTDQEFFFIDTIFKFDPFEDVLIAKYLYHFLLSHPQRIKGLIENGRIRKSDLEELVLPVPPLEIQKRIVNDLDNNFPEKARVHSEEIMNDFSQEATDVEQKSL